MSIQVQLRDQATIRKNITAGLGAIKIKKRVGQNGYNEIGLSIRKVVFNYRKHLFIVLN